jgi:GNAT superfamily N-acetyltransferase
MNRIPGHPPEEIVRLVEENLWATWSNFGRAPGCTLHDEGDLLWFETPIPFHPYNTVLKFQVEQDVDRRIDELLGHLATRGVPVLWIVHPSGRPHDLADRLRARKLQEFETAPGMVRTLEDLPEAPPLPDGVEIREAHEDTDLGVLSEFAAWRWGVPEAHRPQLHDILTRFQIGRPDSKTRMWMAYKDGVPISKVGLYDGPGSAGIYAVATKPAARGLGIATILMVVAMRAAKEMGHEVVVLDSSPMAEKLYQRLGFVTVTNFRLFADVPASL